MTTPAADLNQAYPHTWRIEGAQYRRQEERRGRRHGSVVREGEPLLPRDHAEHQSLSDRDVDTVIVVGTVTNVCCESTARDANTMGYRVIVVADATATVDDEMHNASLTTIYRSFGDVRSTGEVLALLEVAGLRSQ